MKDLVRDGRGGEKEDLQWFCGRSEATSTGDLQIDASSLWSRLGPALSSLAYKGEVRLYIRENRRSEVGRTLQKLTVKWTLPGRGETGRIFPAKGGSG